ncbi:MULTISPECIES: LuxR C-terminal-related transcriptional regulator [unclassified Streptomyces]|uniref:LuxR C-terminal-related transcriptional regulator n=1 Tax=unclassified Streptomyces TaxID=2593676 RepID=UPI003FD1E80B
MIPDEEFSADVYAWVLRQSSASAGEIQETFNVPPDYVENSLRHLADLKLITFLADDRTRLIGISPSKAHVELVAPIEQEISDKRLTLSEIHSRLQRFGDVYDAVQRSGLHSETSITTRDREQIQWRLADAAAHCSSKVFLMQSGDIGDAYPLRVAEPFLVSLLRRGIDVRLIAPHTARAHTQVRTLLSGIAAAGARVRTSDEPPENLLIFDGSTAFAFAPEDPKAPQAPEAAEPPSAPDVTVVYDAAAVEILSRLHAHAWDSGIDFDSSSAGYGEAFGAVQNAILGLLATGLKDEVIARRLGMSERTFRRHIAAIMDRLGVQSRFQAGVSAAHVGLVRASWLLDPLSHASA